MNARRLGAAIVASILAAGCTATSATEESVAGLPVTEGPSGLRPDAPPPTVRALGAASSPEDAVALSILSDLNEFWGTHFREVSDRPFEPLSLFLSWQSSAAPHDAGIFCHVSTSGLENAAFCPADMSIGWDRTVLLPYVREHFGEIGIAAIMAHEFGHAVSTQAGFLDTHGALTGEPLFVWEQQADCYSGAYMRYVAEGSSRWLTLSTGEGLSVVLAAMVAIRDTDLTAPETGHGSGFDRVSAFQRGFSEGATRCSQINSADLTEQRSLSAREFAGPADTGDLPVTVGTVTLAADSFADAFSMTERPALDFDSPCPEAASADTNSTAPVRYCTDTNTLSVDVERLAARASEAESDGPFPATVRGDFSAFSIVASRMALALMHTNGGVIEGRSAARAAACYVGAWARHTGATNAGRIYLSPGDLDEALSELLSGDVIASDINGEYAPHGFARVSAFRAGINEGADAC